jgi:hypothetical protein
MIREDKMDVARHRATTPPDGAQAQPSAVPLEPATLHDLRFRALLGATAWSGLPATVQQRFGRRLLPGTSVTYAGKIVGSRRTLLGVLLATTCRLIGAPLPLNDDLGVPAVVTITEDGEQGGQFWTRLYGRRHGFPQAIHSNKRFAGPTGLEEYLGWGFGIALTVTADATALRFHSDHYFFRVGRVRLSLPWWLEPGDLTISHVDRGDGWFAFILELRHPLVGALIHQTGLFRECTAAVREESMP